MISYEKQLASESVPNDVDESVSALDTSMLDDSDREFLAEEESHLQQAKQIVEVDNVIAEKEEILTKLLDTVRGYSAMKVIVTVSITVVT